MRVIICVLSLWAIASMSAEFDMTLIEPDVHPAHGFDGFAFGSSRSYIKSELADEGREIDREYAEWVWYSGEVEGCVVESGYAFQNNALDHGIWVITNNQPCFARIQDLLSRTYGNRLNMTVNGDDVRVEMDVQFTRILHRMTDEYHSVTFHDTSPVTN